MPQRPNFTKKLPNDIWEQIIATGKEKTCKEPSTRNMSMNVAHAYGMIQSGASDTSTVRATLFIDDEGVLRAMVYYPMSNGRSIPEFVRLLTAMQISDKNKIATPKGCSRATK